MANKRLNIPTDDTDSVVLNVPESRGNWERRIEFTLSCLGYAVGLGNIWRFPYLCIRNGGGAFLIPYFTFLVLCGIPLYVMELCLGQFAGLSPLSLWKLCPLFKGIGWSMIIVSIIGSIYYNVVTAWILYFLGMSMRQDVPWRTCDNEWNTPDCYMVEAVKNMSLPLNSTSSIVNETSTVKTGHTAAEEFWTRKVLDLSDGIDNLGPIKWDLLLCLVGAWVVIFLCLFKGIKSSGKVVYVTAVVPYILLTILLVRGVTLPGSLQGIKYYIIPDFSQLANFKVWTEACLQVFFSLGPAWGGLITMSSYNKFNYHCINDAVIVSFICGLSSFFAGFAIFSVIGYMAHEANIPLDKVIFQGPGLAFIAYPEAIAKLPFSPFWACCFFLTLFTVGVEGQFVTAETVTSGFIDEFPQLLKKRRMIFNILAFTSMLLMGFPFVTRGGMYLFQITDWYAAAFSVTSIAFAECTAVAYIYGIGRFYDDMTLMFKKPPARFWAVFWCAITPIILFSMLVVSAVQMSPPRYGDYEFPTWAIVLGWLLAMASIVPLPLVASYRIFMAKGSFIQRVQTLLKPDADWGPQEPGIAEIYKNQRQRNEGESWIERMSFKKGPYISEHNHIDSENVTLDAYSKA